MTWSHDQAVAALDTHLNLESSLSVAEQPTLERVSQLVGLMGDPQRSYPVIHLTGTNGKGSTARMITALLVTRGLSVGTYTSPDLQGVNERLTWNEEPISDEALAEVLEGVIRLEELMGGAPTRFEILTASAYRWFADVAVDVAVVEVGLGGRWDATNVADAEVAVVTNVSLDHAEILGPTLADIAWEKAGIVKATSRLVLGENDATLAPIFRHAGATATWERGVDFECEENQPAHGGRLVDLRTPASSYEEIYLPLHGSHQGENAAVALAAAETFFGAPLSPDVVEEGFGEVRVPGRMEVVSRHPLVLLDGAHNPAGAEAAAITLASEFPATQGRVIVIGLLRGRDAGEMLRTLAGPHTRAVVACAPPSPRALPAAELAAAARAIGLPAETAGSVEEAVERGIAMAQSDDLVFVTGSLYVVGAARDRLVSSPA